MNSFLRPFLLILTLSASVGACAQTASPTPAPAAGTSPPAPAPAADAPSASWTFTPTFASQYMFRGVRLGGPAFEPSLEYDNGNLALGVWTNVPLKDKVSGQSDPEVDPYGSYTIEVFKDTLSYAPGFTLYTYPRAKRSDGFYKLTFEPNLAVNYTVGALKLTPKVYYDFVLKGPTLELNAAYTVPLKAANTELDFSGTLGTYKWTHAVPDVAPDIKNWGNYWLVGVAAPFQTSKDTKLTVGWAYTKGSDNFFKQGTAGKFANGAAVSRGVLTISYAITF